MGLTLQRKYSGLLLNFIALSLLPLLIFGIAVTIYGALAFSKNQEEQARENLAALAHSLRQTYALAHAGDYRRVGSLLYKGDDLLSGDTSILDEIRVVSDFDATIFFEDVRMITTIRSTDGSRAVGTRADPVVASRVLKEGRHYFSSDILVNGIPYFGYYIPLANADGTTVGMAFIGKTRAEMQHVLQETIRHLIFTAIFILCAAVAFCFFYANSILRALQCVMRFLGEIAADNLRAKLDRRILKRNDEIGEIGRFALQLQKSIAALICTDPLTQLPNRRSCNHALQEALASYEASGQTFCVAMGDIDGFKQVNDQFGHLFGDEVLKHIAKLAAAQLKGRGIAFRWGGEEFLFLLPGLRRTEASALLEQLRAAIEATPTVVNAASIPVTMTFGVVECAAGCDLETLLKTADDRLYFGKSNGKNQVV